MAAFARRGLDGLGASILAGLLLGGVLAPASLARAQSAGKIPSLEDAAKQEIHGLARLRKKQVQILYDFRKPEQGADFVIDRMRGMVVIAPGSTMSAAPPPEERPTVEPGKLVLPPSTWLSGRLPLAEIQQISITVQGANGYSLRLREGKQQVTVNFAAQPSISFDEGVGLGDSKRNLKLVATDRYELAVEIRGGKVIGKLDGKLLVDKEMPAEMGALSELSFGPSIFATASEEPVLITAIQIAGVVSDTLPLLAANRGRGERLEPPLWEKGSTSAGSHVTVTASDSAGRAERFAKRLDGIVLGLLRAYPIDASSPEGGAEGGGVPVDRKAPPFEYARTVHLFPDAEVLAAYSGEPRPLVALPSGDIAFLDRADDGEAARLLALDRRIATEAFERFYAAAPWWWSAGNCAAAALDAERDPADPNVPAEYVAKAMHHLGRGIEPRLSDIVRGWSPGKGQDGPVELAWAWVHFLRHGDGGGHAFLLRRYHEELRLGRSGPEATQLVFPTEVFDDLYGKFQSHLKSLAPAK